MTDTKPSGKMTTHGSAFLQDMVGYGAESLAKLTDMPADSCEQIAHHLANLMKSHWGGSMLYVPKTNPDQLHERDLQIWQDFNGGNHHELHVEYDLSVVTIYQILAKVRKAHSDKQKDLFDE